MPRPVILGIIGDSASGKTTLTRGLVRCWARTRSPTSRLDGYHRFDRATLERGLTPLDPECNHMDMLAQHLRHLRAGSRSWRRSTANDGHVHPPRLPNPGRFAVVEGLLGVPHPSCARPTTSACSSTRPRTSPAVEGRARLLAARLHDGPGPRGARPPGARTPRPTCAPSAATRISSSRSCPATAGPGAPRCADRHAPRPDPS